jgi:hypothetical protein
MASNPRKELPESDPFDSAKILADQKTAQENIAELSNRLQALEIKLGNSSHFASFLENVTEESLKVHSVFKKVFDRFLGDEDSKKKILQIVDDKDRDFVSMNMKRFMGLMLQGLMYLLGVLTTAGVAWFLKVSK